ncbi:hypothetical protein, partial [Paenibacillus alginolyticus]
IHRLQFSFLPFGIASSDTQFCKYDLDCPRELNENGNSCRPRRSAPVFDFFSSLITQNRASNDQVYERQKPNKGGRVTSF